ncbi:MAG: DNA translocase FtsK 4TM domain-containing protein [Flavobacteriaceae bacterium]|nr:DNA translocase FtsK 4TM domain-containing protein [Flavobacteriaceae bacterium]
MAKNTKSTTDKQDKAFKDRQYLLILGLFIILFSIFLFFAFVSYFFNWQTDQSQLSEFTNKSVETKNIIGKIGSALGHLFIFNGVGLSAIYIPFLLFFSGGLLVTKGTLKSTAGRWGWGVLAMIWIAVLFGFSSEKQTILSGVVGYETNHFLQQFLGKTGLILVLGFLLLSYLIVRFKITPEMVKNKFQQWRSQLSEKKKDFVSKQEPTTPKDSLEILDTLEKDDDITKDLSLDTETKKEPIVEKPKQEKPKEEEEVKIDVAVGKEEEHEPENTAEKLVENFGEFDPRLELANYTFPKLDLLKKYDETISVDEEELEANKNRIVETLGNYGVSIDKIKATVGPTVTLYEIVPSTGVRISKIKNLEDDIALSLSALGIRIIAPIPGKGTIGIEVPNKKASIVSMHSVISSVKFQKSEMQLPVAIGKTISNETFVVDLAKMPHLLMAGATGQGKSVGLNAVLTSLLYKKHPAEVKFVLVDPKKVELTLFNKIERHFLAKLPNEEEAIITDTTKVVNTLNSLCIEMDNRYDLLKTAMVRNIKEYNQKFKERKLNPDNGHQFLPYIVLVIDEFADLIMTAGKEVETPIARLAQLARAIGIHLIVATQRPSVNVITGLIKANFPARIAFRVTSKIDSRTILDAPGADQLIGRGDMLYSGGSEITRIQCAFVDTPEVERITDFVGAQRAYPDAHLLPEYVGEDNGTSLDNDISERDELFYDAATVIVNAQQGSASLLQRKLKLGYNRAGRLIDQLEAAGIVGPFEGSKARQVLIPDEFALKQLIEGEKENL